MMDAVVWCDCRLDLGPGISFSRIHVLHFTKLEAGQ